MENLESRRPGAEILTKTHGGEAFGNKRNDNVEVNQWCDMYEQSEGSDGIMKFLRK